MLKILTLRTCLFSDSGRAEAATSALFVCALGMGDDRGLKSLQNRYKILRHLS